MLTQAIASLVVVAVFGGLFMIITVVRNKFMDNVNPKGCNGMAEGRCETCPSICDTYRNELYKKAFDEIAKSKDK
ncbi:MAG: hypothetical protein PUB09_06175 [Firmicutes bacterium]|nr:hypothetical protein [Bacillota bacterium]